MFNVQHSLVLSSFSEREKLSARAALSNSHQSAHEPIQWQRTCSLTFLTGILHGDTTHTTSEEFNRADTMIITIMLLTAATVYAKKHGGGVWQACVCDNTVDEAEEERVSAAAAATEDPKEQ
jgi:hypothetical protein